MKDSKELLNYSTRLNSRWDAILPDGAQEPKFSVSTRRAFCTEKHTRTYLISHQPVSSNWSSSSATRFISFSTSQRKKE